MITTMSPQGAFALATFEGIVPGPYLDSVKVWTWGIGHTKDAGAPDPAAMGRGMPEDLAGIIAAAIKIYRRDLQDYAADVVAAVKVPVAQHEFDALVSFHYNTGAIGHASLVGALNAGLRKSAAAEFLNWLKPESVLDRRTKEMELFRDGTYPAGPVPVWQVSVGGHVIWKPIQTLTFDQFIAAFSAGD